MKHYKLILASSYSYSHWDGQVLSHIPDGGGGGGGGGSVWLSNANHTHN